MLVNTGINKINNYYDHKVIDQVVHTHKTTNVDLQLVNKLKEVVASKHNSDISRDCLRAVSYMRPAT